MNVQAHFSEEDWAGMIQGPMVAGFPVAADQCGLIGSVQGCAAMARSLTQAAEGTRAAEASTAAAGRPGGIMRTVRQLAPDQENGLRDFLMTTARATAEARSEGGVLRFGGVGLCQAERRSLDALQAVPAASLRQVLEFETQSYPGDIQ